jgi:hypothetical protein
MKITFEIWIDSWHKQIEKFLYCFLMKKANHMEK